MLSGVAESSGQRVQEKGRMKEVRENALSDVFLLREPAGTKFLQKTSQLKFKGIYLPVSFTINGVWLIILTSHRKYQRTLIIS